MDQIGLVNSINDAVINIDSGRKGLATKGKAEAGRMAFERGITEALSTFKEAQVTTDPYIIILAEYTFLNQELQFCEEADTDSKSSLTQAIQSFDDAFLALKVVQYKKIYQGAEQTYPHNKKYRINNFPKDSFHIACIAHRTRLQNILRAPGLNPIEKTLLKQRLINLSTAQSGYLEKQRKAITEDEEDKGNSHVEITELG